MHGFPVSWEPVVATAYRKGLQRKVAWSPCNKFIAVAVYRTVEIRDAVTLNLLSTFEFPYGVAKWLLFSPDGCILTAVGHQHLITWDLQTGGSIRTSLPVGPRTCLSDPISHSVDGRILAVLAGYPPEKPFIYTHNLSTTHTHRYQPPEGFITSPTWTHGEFLRFATVKPGNITIWEAEFTSIHTPKLVEALSAPDEIGDTEAFDMLLFLPEPSRLVIAFENTLLIWDARDSKLLLKLSPVYTGGDLVSFSSDGRFFAFPTGDFAFVVWKESPAGYAFHQKLEFASGGLGKPLLSPNGKSIVIVAESVIHLWHTKDPIPSGGSRSIRASFVLGYCPNETAAAFTRYSDKTITIIDLKSGGPQLTIDTGVEVDALRVTGSTVAAVGGGEVAIWDLAAGSRGANINDSVRITSFHPLPLCSRSFRNASISPDLRHVVILEAGEGWHLGIYNASTGRWLASTRVPHLGGHELWFTPDGCEIWAGSREDTSVIGWGIIEDSESNVVQLQPLVNQCRTLPWVSSRGYTVTDDGWILSPTQKRLLWLPHRWRSNEQSRKWSGRFLGLRHFGLPEIVILEFFE